LAGASNEYATTAIFVDLSGYFFGNFRDKASNIIMAICYPLSADKRLRSE